MACTFYNDCCTDYKDTCSNDNEFQKILTSRNIRKVDLHCVKFDFFSRYWMITTCNKDLGIVKEKCENPRCNDSLSNVPVTDSVGISYRNVYCAVCHNVDTSELTAWEATFPCRVEFLTLPGQKPPDELDYMCSNCVLSLQPPNAITVRKCQTSMISTCRNDSKEGYNGCEQYMALVRFGREIFKNPHCLMCNKDNLTDLLSCEGKGIPDYIPQDYVKSHIPQYTPVSSEMQWSDGVSFSILLNFKDSSTNGINMKIKNQETDVNCNKGEVFVDMGVAGVECIKVSCADGLKLKDSICIPDTSVTYAPCDSSGGNNTIEAKLVMCNVSCQQSFMNTSKNFLKKLFYEDLSLVSYEEEFTACEHDFEETVIVVIYIVFGSVDLFATVQDRLDSNLIKRSSQDVSGISNNIKELEITKSCLNPDLEYRCDSDWIPNNEYTLVPANTSYSVFLNRTSKWITADGIVFRLRYEQTINVESGLQKNSEVKICYIDNYLPCPFLTMNISLFERLNSTGEIRYLPNGRILKPTEYKITTGDQVLICNFFNQSGVISEIVTFFEYSRAQTIISIIGGVLSLIAIILTLLTYAVFAVLRNRASRLIINLVIALFLAQFLLLFGANQTQNEDICFIIAVVAHYAWLAAFAWMNALAFDLDRTFGNPDNLKKARDTRKVLFLYMMYAWGSPFLVVIPCIAIHFCQCTTLAFRYGSSSACWISDGTANLLTFGVPAAIFVLCNGCLFGHTVIGIRSAKKASARIQKDKSSKLKQTAKELLIYIKVSNPT